MWPFCTVLIFFNGLFFIRCSCNALNGVLLIYLPLTPCAIGLKQECQAYGLQAGFSLQSCSMQRASSPTGCQELRGVDCCRILAVSIAVQGPIGGRASASCCHPNTAPL